MPAHIETITIPVFSNHSNEPNIEKLVTEAVIQKFQSIGKPRLVDEGEADAILLGDIIKYTPNVPLSFEQGQNIREFRMEIIGNIIIKEKSSGKILWQKNGHYAKREYTLAGQLDISKERELLTKKDTAFEFARDLASVLEGF